MTCFPTAQTSRHLGALRWLLAGLVALFLNLSVCAAEWQWSVPVPKGPGSEPGEARAFLWIPPSCKHVRGVVFAQHNMEEIGILEHPLFRQTLAELDFAEVWVAPGFDGHFRFDLGAGQRFDQMMAALAQGSGYDELAAAPLLPMGHSAAASLPWHMAAWKPERIIAGLSISGQWPYWPDPDAPQVANRNFDSVPGLVTVGEYEWAEDAMKHGLKFLEPHPTMPLSALGCPSDGHFVALADKIAFLSLYVKKAAQYRLPAKNAAGSSQLLPIDVKRTGWLVPRWTEKISAVEAASVQDYHGDRKQAFWYFDAETAQAAATFHAKQRGRATLLGLVQEGKLVPQVNGTHQQVTLNFLPQEDGVSFKLETCFLSTVPEGRPERWTHKKAGETNEVPTSSVPIELMRICGPVTKKPDGTWRLAFDRSSFLGDRRGNQAWLAAVWPGDQHFKRAVQQVLMNIPGKLDQGRSQIIDFPQVPPVKLGTASIELAAKSSSGLPVSYFVREGPAEIAGGKLIFSTPPPRSKFPITITVVAYQFGRAPDTQTAPHVIHAIELNP